MNLLLWFTPGALRYWLYDLPQWQRERVAEAIPALLNQPRLYIARHLSGYRGETYEIWAGDRRILYRIYKDGQGKDLAVVIARV